MQGYRDMPVWHASMDLALAVYRVSSAFPTYDRFGLTAQMRHAGVSIAFSIAEGHACTHRSDSLHHLSIARRSAMEVKVQLLIAEYLGYADTKTLAVARERCDAVCRMLTQLKRALANQ